MTPELTIKQVQAGEVIDIRHQVLRQGRPRETAVFDADHAPTTTHFAALIDNRPVAVASVMACPSPEPTTTAKLQLRGMAVLPRFRGQGIGSALLHDIHDAMQGPLWCNARETAVTFYADNGWRPVGQTFHIDPIGPHRRMFWTPS